MMADEHVHLLLNWRTKTSIPNTAKGLSGASDWTWRSPAQKRRHADRLSGREVKK
jgi:hypothetical protein